jgi:hypothetical protein
MSDSTYGTLNNFHLSSHANVLDGSLELTYDFTATPTPTGKIQYSGPGASPTWQGPYQVTWNPANPVNGVARGSFSIPIPTPPLVVPGQYGGPYRYGALIFTLPSGDSKGTLTGSFSSQPPGGPPEDDPLAWDADPSVPEPEAHKTAAPGKY